MSKEQKELRVVLIKIKNILGIQTLEVRPGAALTIVTGENAGGKTSFVEALKAVFKGGQDISLLKMGAESGEILVELNNGVKIERTVRPTGSATMVTDPTYGQIRKPAAFLEQLIDKLGVNPIDFLVAPAKMRVQLLLEAMPIKLDNDLIEPIIGHTVDELDTNALELIDREHKRFYDDRTGVNRVAKEKRATILQMKQTLPEGDDDTDWSRVVRTSEAQLKQHDDAVQSEIDQARETIVTGRMEIEAMDRSEVDKIKAKLAEDISRLQKEADAKIEGVHEICNTGRNTALQSGERTIDAMQEKAKPGREKLSGKLAVAEQNAANQSKINQTKEYIDLLGKEATVNELASDRCTKAIEALAGLKTKLLNDLPIKGVEVKDGELFVDGIPFDRVNEARKVEIAIQIAGLRSGKLPLIIVDGLERLDSKTFAAFVVAAKKSKAQMIVTRVSDSALAVEA